MPPTVLKGKHSLKGKNIFSLVKKVRDFQNDDLRGASLARLSTQQRTEELAKEDCVRCFKEITGEEAEEFLVMTGREFTESNCRILLHCTIVHANLQGQAGQVPSAPETVTSEANDELPTEEEPVSKKKKTEDDLAKRVALLEQGQESVDSMKEKVRALSLQSNLNEALLLLAMDDLAGTARRKRHPEAETYEELARQATRHQASINIASLALGVVGVKL